MKVHIQIEDPEVKARENAFWMSVLGYIEPLFLWYVIQYLMNWPLFGGWSVVTLVIFVVIRFVYILRLVIFSLAWGIILYQFTTGTLLPGWLDILAILLVVGGRFWFLFSNKK